MTRRAHRRTAPIVAFALLVALALAPAAEARTSRDLQSSIDLGSSSGPTALAVDQANGDLYVAVANRRLSRFDSTGAPRNFTAGPDAGTNTLIAGLGNISGGAIAIDDSGGPLDGTIYVADFGALGDDPSIEAFSRTGAPLGEIEGIGIGGMPNAGTSLAVDPAGGDLYVAISQRNDIWRYAPASPSGALDDADFNLIGGVATFNPRDLAADSGTVYAIRSNIAEVYRFSASDFIPTQPELTGERFSPVTTATSLAVDPAGGELYVHKGNEVEVFDSTGASQYRFGAAAYFGHSFEGIAVDSAGSGPADAVYVSDPTSDHQVDVFGPLSLAPTYTRSQLGSFGPDGSAATSFGTLRNLDFDGAADRLFGLDINPDNVYGFDASAPPAFAPLAGFDPLAAPATTNESGLAVDDTALASAGNFYIVSRETDLLYGYDDAGAPLAGFPVDPAIIPGGAAGNPADLCGAAVDSSGEVWLSNAATDKLLGYDSSGAFVASVDVAAQGDPCHLAIDSADDLYLVQANNFIYKRSAASGYATATKVGGGSRVRALAVNPADDHLYVALAGFSCTGCAFTQWVDEYDADGEFVDEFAGSTSSWWGLAADPATGNVYAAQANKIHAFGPGLLLPEPRTQPASAIANDAATLNGTVSNQGVALDSCEFEYVSETAFQLSGFTDLSSGGRVACDQAPGSIPLDLADHPVSVSVTGLETDTVYRFRLLASNADGDSATAAGSLATASPAAAETTGTPLRTTTTARLLGRVHPKRAATDYHFEYGAQGPCDANPCEQTPTRSAGSGDVERLVAEQVEGLDPDTTYHYRLVADNGNPDGAAAGADITVTTRSSEGLAGQSDEYPGPPGSDRAWEQVSLPDSNGNPVVQAQAFSDDGDTGVYGIAGGTSLSEAGSLFSLYHSERPAGEHPTTGWQTRVITPPRAQTLGPSWDRVYGRSDLSSYVSVNYEGILADPAYWRLSPDAPPQKLAEIDFPQEAADWGSAGTSNSYFNFTVSADGSRVVARFEGGDGFDPDHPAAAAVPNVYDISSGGDPELVSLLPGEVVPACGASASTGAFAVNQAQLANWVSDDGRLLYFPSRGDGPCGSAAAAQLYLRDLVAEETNLISGPPLSGLACGAGLIKATPGAAFFATQTRLDPDDSEPAPSAVGPSGCTGSNDVYRYDLATEALECLTCVTPGLSGNVVGTDFNRIAVAESGERLYFSSSARLLREAPASANGIYRLDVASGDIAYVASNIGDIGDGQGDVHITPDGSTLLFASSAALDPLGEGLANGGLTQFYRYDDSDRSLLCVSCPLEGSPASSSANGVNSGPTGYRSQANVGALSADGQTMAFRTSAPLLGEDHNGAGGDAAATDVYEWRDGRQALITDGDTVWGRLRPLLEGVSPSGRDVFFRAPVAYTQDALDTSFRLYTARIGGGIDFPPTELPPCDLNAGACEGPASAAPDLPGAGAAVFEGPGDPRDPFPRDCSAAAKRASKLNRVARSLRKRARRAGNPRRAKALRRKAAKASRVAKKARRGARKCRRANRRTSR